MWPGPTAAPSNVVPVSITVEQDEKCEAERSYTEHFSKSTLRDKLKQFEAGKYTKRYIDAYLEFCHLSGFITNLEYLEIKQKLPKE